MGRPRKCPFSHERQGVARKASAERVASVDVVHRAEDRVKGRDFRDEDEEDRCGLPLRGWMTLFRIGNADLDHVNHET